MSSSIDTIHTNGIDWQETADDSFGFFKGGKGKGALPVGKGDAPHFPKEHLQARQYGKMSAVIEALAQWSVTSGCIGRMAMTTLSTTCSKVAQASKVAKVSTQTSSSRTFGR